MNTSSSLPLLAQPQPTPIEPHPLQPTPTPTPSKAMLLEVLSEDDITSLVSFLWFQDIAMLRQCCKGLYDFFEQHTHILGATFLRYLNRTGFSIRDSSFNTSGLNFRNMMDSARRLSDWPTKVDVKLVNKTSNDLKEVNVDEAKNICVAYQGVKQGGNRTMVANNRFPFIFLETDTHLLDPVTRFMLNICRPTTAYPFTKIHKQKSSGLMSPVLSRVAYFEIKIHTPVPPETRDRRTPPQYSPCVAIGLCRTPFDRKKRMPGWDKLSYGWHSDDGLFYHGKYINFKMFLLLFLLIHGLI